MGRPDPCVLFAQSFVHSQLDEYVDEVLFAEPVVITACEFLEQNASPSVPTVSLIGATSPPSFALEVFVQCEGEPRFRRLCPAFLYSHSASNCLEVEAVVTSHLVVRGSYRSLTLVVYGNTAEDLGQFNIEFDLDNSLVNLVSSTSEEKLEDLHPVFYSTSLPFGQSISALISLSLTPPEFDISKEIKEFLHLTLRIFQISGHEETVCKLVNYVVSAIAPYISCVTQGMVSWNLSKMGKLDERKHEEHVINVVSQARTELLALYKCHKSLLGNEKTELVDEEVLTESEDLFTSEQIVFMYNQCSKFRKYKHLSTSQSKAKLLQMGIVMLLCSAKESCFRFVTSGGMEQIINILCKETHKSTVIVLMVLAIIEHATRHAIGCEGILGWWPREDENMPIGTSDGYNHLLSLLLQKTRADIASLTTYILHRLRLYEIISRYECSVVSILGELSADGCITTEMSQSLLNAKLMLKKVLKLITFTGQVEDPQPLSSAQTSITGQVEGLSYKATVDFIASSKYSFAAPDIDTHLLFLFKERGFFPLSAALLSSSILRTATSRILDTFLDIAASIELIILSLLHCRSGLTFLLLQPEVMATIILSLKGVEGLGNADCLTLSEACALISKGFFCPPEDVGMIMDLHLRVVLAIDRLLVSGNHSEEQLWLLWDLCATSRTESGREALLVIGRFPEAICVLLEALRSFKGHELIGANNNGTSPLNLVVFHCAAEIFEVLVTDPSAVSLSSWIGHAMDLHRALHSSSPGSSRKDAPTRLLEWIDAGVVYHKNGAIGLLRYAAVLASGGDAHLSSTTVLVSDSVDVENVVGDSANGSDSQILDNLLGKLVSEKYFHGLTLCNTSIVQLTTAFRILAFISENPVVAASLYEEGAVSLIYVVMINCKLMLERSSNNYDHLVDEGAECNYTSDLLLERSREQSLVDLLVPSLILLINILHKLKEAKEQYRNSKLLNALLKLHREISPRVASCATELSLPFPSSALGLHAVCRLLVSALTCWPIFGWAPGLFHCILENVHVTLFLTLGPKDGCSLFCLLADLLPEEGIWLWKNGMPALSALRSLSIGTILGSEGESYADWYLQPEYQLLLFGRLKQQLDQVAQIVLHFSFTALDVLQDMLRVFIVRLACQKTDFAVEVLRPTILWLHKQIHEASMSDIIMFKVCRLLNFIASLLEHPCTKLLLLNEGIYNILAKALERCCEAATVDLKGISDSMFQVKTASCMLAWTIPVFKSLSLIFCSQAVILHADLNEQNNEKLSMQDNLFVWHQLLKICQLLPVGKELLACLLAIKEMAFSSLGRSTLAVYFTRSTSNPVGDPQNNDTDLAVEFDWTESPFLNCWRKLLRSLEAKDDTSFCVEAIHTLSTGALSICIQDNNVESLKLLKFLFGLPYGSDEGEGSLEEKLKDVHDMIALFDRMNDEHENVVSSCAKYTVHQVKETVMKLLQLLQRPTCLPAEEDDSVPSQDSFVSISTRETISKQQFVPSGGALSFEDIAIPSVLDLWKILRDVEKAEDILGGLSGKFMWDFPDSSSDRLMTPSLPVKRKLSSSDGPSRRARDNAGFEAVASNAFARGMGAPSSTSGPSRRDTFRQRKPNTSRPPSMHVDDYVARERNIEGINISAGVVGSSQRGGSTSGRPPSIHVDEFMARQRERRNLMAGTAAEVSQIKSSTLESDGCLHDKSDTSQLIKTDIEDDLPEIDIVFDEESESDDRLPFPQPDDNIQPAPVIAGENSPSSIVEENEGDVNGDSQSEFFSMTSLSRPGLRSVCDGNVPSDKSHRRTNTKKLSHEHSDESKYIAPVVVPHGADDSHARHANGFTPNLYGVSGPIGDIRPSSSSFHLRESQQKPQNTSTMKSHGNYEQTLPLNQPPLPPTPPPVSSVPSQNVEPVQHLRSPYVQPTREMQPPLPSGFPLQAYDSNASSKSATVHIKSDHMLLPINSSYIDSKYSWTTVSSKDRINETLTSTCSRPVPPLPPTPPPLHSSSMSQPLMINSGPQSFSSSQYSMSSAPLNDPRFGLFPTGGSPSFTMPPITSFLITRPASSPAALASPSTQQGLNISNPSPVIPSHLASVHNVHAHPLPPPPPPQLPRPPHLSQSLRQPLQVSQTQTEQMVSLQQNGLQVQPLQAPQQIPIPQLHLYQQAQQESLQQVPQSLTEQRHLLNQYGTTESSSQQDSGATFQKYFSSPEAIQALLSDRDKLCQLLEQHPKLMQMIQERLGQT